MLGFSLFFSALLNFPFPSLNEILENESCPRVGALTKCFIFIPLPFLLSALLSLELPRAGSVAICQADRQSCISPHCLLRGSGGADHLTLHLFYE